MIRSPYILWYTAVWTTLLFILHHHYQVIVFRGIFLYSWNDVTVSHIALRR